MTVENVIKPKSRMAARGFDQIKYYVDFSETFAPTTLAASVKINVAVANEKGRLLRHLFRHKAGVYPGALGRSCIHEASPLVAGAWAVKPSCCSVLCTDSDRLVESGVCG